MIPKPIKDFFQKFREGTHYLDYGRDVIIEMLEKPLTKIAQPIKILDVGMGNGYDIEEIRKRFPLIKFEFSGIDAWERRVRDANKNNIRGFHLNIEKEKFPFEDGYFDVVIANQVIEHTKEIFFIFSEISRVLKPKGTLIIGVPNLAALHNRILLLFGEHPPCIKIFGPHVRGITKLGFASFITADHYFKINEIKGSNFYPFPPKLAIPLSRIFPTLSVSLYFMCSRTDKAGTYIKVLDSETFETEYYTG